MASLLAAGASEKTVRVYRAAIEDFLEFIRDKPLRMVNGEDVRKWRMERLRKGFPRKRRNKRNGDPVEERRWRQMTLHYYTLLLRGFFEWLNLDVRVPIVKAPRRREVEALSEQEVYALLNASRDVLDILIVALLVETGLRAQEALELRWRDIDFNTGEIRVRAAKYGEERIVFYGPLTRQALYAWFNQKRPKAMDEKVLGLSYSGLYKRLKSLAKRAGLDSRKIRPHVLRHTFATQALRKGMSLIAVQKLLGHRDVKVTQVYTHLLKEDLRMQYNAAFGRLQVNPVAAQAPLQPIQVMVSQPSIMSPSSLQLVNDGRQSSNTIISQQPIPSRYNGGIGLNQYNQQLLQMQQQYMQSQPQEPAALIRETGTREQQYAVFQQALGQQSHQYQQQHVESIAADRGARSANGAVITCPYCGAFIPANSIYCPRCGAKLRL